MPIIKKLFIRTIFYINDLFSIIFLKFINWRDFCFFIDKCHSKKGEKNVQTNQIHLWPKKILSDVDFHGFEWMSNSTPRV
jgi:hypothetical protein